MAKLFTILFLVLIALNSHAMASKQPEPKPSPDQELPQAPTFFDGTVKFTVNAKGTVSQVARLTRLTGIASLVLHDPEFEHRVRGAMTRSGKAFTYSNHSGSQVWEAMIAGAELLTPPDNTWQLEFVFEAKPRKCFGVGRFKKCAAWVYGWTNPTAQKIWINSLPWDERDDCGIVGTIFHEQLHKFGYAHPYDPTSDRPESVPYAVGNLASEICKKFLKK